MNAIETESPPEPARALCSPFDQEVGSVTIFFGSCAAIAYSKNRRDGKKRPNPLIILGGSSNISGSTSISGMPLDPDSTSTSRSRLLAAGKELFARHGYEQASTAAIARLAGTSESQLVRYFDGKAGLLQAIFNESWR